ncbi:MAG: 50S ribosomal protein L24 [Actinomycetota bacterium]|jgi:large subunit ribosomal protein L24|nr:50S ribosomal protein L24 [Actinomycetota bacterium]
MLKIKKDDKVKVIQGKDRGKTGKVLRVDTRRGKVFVEGLNMIKRHTRSKGQNEPGGIINKEGPLHISNVSVICPQCGKPARIGFTEGKAGKKVRVCKKCGEQI